MSKHYDIDTVEKLKASLRYWQSFCILDAHIPLTKAVATLNTPERVVEARQDYAGRWVVSLVWLYCIPYTHILASALPCRSEAQEACDILHSGRVAMEFGLGDGKLRARG